MAVTGEMDTTNMVVWLVRILLPIIFFFIWYRLGSSEGNAEDQHTREELLLAREIVKGCEVPECLNNIKLVDEARVAQPSPQRQQRGAAGARPKRGDTTRNRNSTDSGIGKRDSERSDAWDDGAFGGEMGGPGSPGEKGDVGSPGTDAESGKGSQPFPSKVERMQFESLLTFVALGHKERPQRVFLPDEGRPPPPPPKKAEPTGLEELKDEEMPETIKANTDAQAMLKAIVNQKMDLKCSHVAKDLHQKLVDQQLKISETTFTLMVEACISCGDLKGASGFLMKMESSGVLPDSGLLDKVMNLYQESRATDSTDGEVMSPIRFGRQPS